MQNTPFSIPPSGSARSSATPGKAPGSLPNRLPSFTPPQRPSMRLSGACPICNSWMQGSFRCNHLRRPLGLGRGFFCDVSLCGPGGGFDPGLGMLVKPFVSWTLMIPVMPSFPPVDFNLRRAFLGVSGVTPQVLMRRRYSSTSS